MGKKFIYSISSHIIPVSRAEQINLPKKTRTLLLQIQLAEESKNWCKLEALFDELGNLYTDAEDWEKLVGIARREVRLADRLGGKDAARVQTRALYRLSKSYRELEQYDAAIDHNLMYVKAAKLLGDPSEQFQSYFELTLAYTARYEARNGDVLGRFDCEEDLTAAEQACAGAVSQLKHLPKTQAPPPKHLKADLNLNMAIILTHKYRHYKTTPSIKSNHGVEGAEHMSKAIEHITRAMAVYREEGDMDSEANAWMNLGVCYQCLDDSAKSISCAKKEIEILKKLNNLESESRAHYDLALRLRHFCHYADALDSARAHLDMCETMDDAEGTSVAKKLISELKESIRKSHRITEINSTIHTMRGSKGNERRILELLTERGNLELELCLTSAATKTFEELRRLAYDIGVGRAILEKILIGLGESLVLSERWEEGAHCFRECLEQFTGTDDCKLRVLERSAECHLYSNHGTSFEATHRVLHSFLVLSRKTGVLEKQEIALQFLVILSRRYGFGGKAAEYLAELEKVEELREHVRSQESQSQSQSFEGSSPIEDSSEANDASESDNDDHGDGATGRQSFVRAKRMNTGTVRQQTTITSLWPTANKLANNDASAVSKKGSDRNTERTRRRAVIEDEDEDDDDEDRDCHVSAELRHSTSPLPIRNGASNKENRGVPPAFAANDAETHKRRLRPRVSQFIAMSVGPSKIRASEDDSRSAVVASTTRHHSPSRPAYTTIADSDSDELPAIEELFGTKNRTTSGDEFDGVVVEVDEIDVSQTQEGALSRREAQKQVRPNMVTERRQQPGRRAKRRRIASASPPEIGAEIGDLPSNHVPSVESRCAEAAETEESMNAIPTTEALQNYMRPAEILPAAPSSEFNLRQEHDGAAAESVAVQSIAGSASQAHHPSNSPTFHRVPQDDGIESTLNVDDNPFLVSTPTPTAFIRHNRYTPTTPPSSRTHRSSSSLVADPPRAPLFPAAQASHPLPHRKRNKVRVQLPLPSTLSNTSSISDFGYETFAIPLPPASRTPPTISHIIHESKRRYKDIYKQSPPRILKWVTLCDDGIEEVVWEGDVWEGEGGLKGIRA